MRSVDEDNDDDDWGDVDEDSSTECPYCGAEMYDDSPRCPECGRYLSEEDRPAEQKPPWVYATALILLFLILFGLWAGGW